MADLVLTIPDDMLPQVEAAIRASYGVILTDDMDTFTAMKAVARYWLAGLMADYAAAQARDAGDAQVAAATAAREQAIVAARKAARDAVEAIPWVWAPATGAAEAPWSVTADAAGSAPLS